MRTAIGRFILGVFLAATLTALPDPLTADSVSGSPVLPENSAAPATGAGDTAGEFGNGLLWRIDGAASESSYLFGTMHVEDPRITELPAPVRRAFDASDSLTTEALLDIEQILMIGTELLLTDGSTLEDLIGAELYGEVTQAMGARGLPPQIGALLKPWAIAVLLSQPRSQGGMFLDRQLYDLALARGKSVFGLESLSEQLQIFNAMSIDDQIELLQETLTHINAIPEMIEKLTQAYLDRNLARLTELANEQFALSGAHSRLKRDLLLDRNIRMVERMAPRLNEGKAFIAIGALHLTGATGLLSLLQQQGYVLTRIY